MEFAMQFGASINGVILCGGMDTIAVMPGYCMTWENVILNAVVLNELYSLASKI